MLNKAFPNDAPKRTTVFEWHSRFKAGRISIEDDPRQGRPKFQRTDENVQKITDLIKENPRTTLLELEQDTGISKTTIGRIVTEDLKLKKTPEKFIPRFFTNEQKLCRLATCEDMMEMTRTDPEWKDKIITGDETWVYGYDPETKPQSAEWRAVRINGFYIRSFHLLNGVKQGCAASAAFFSLATGPLLHRLEQLLGSKNVLAYADDIVLHEFRRASGIHISFGKSRELWCSEWQNRTETPLGICWTCTHLKIPGSLVTTGAGTSAQENHLTALVETAIAKWSPFVRDLSLVGRTRAANSLVLFAVVHHLHGYLPTDSTIAKLKVRLVRFVWGPQCTAWLPGSVLARSESVGRLRVLCCQHAASTIFLKRSAGHTAWKPQRLLLFTISMSSETAGFFDLQIFWSHSGGRGCTLVRSPAPHSSLWTPPALPSLTSRHSKPSAAGSWIRIGTTPIGFTALRTPSETATAFPRLTTRTDRRMLERLRLAALSITQLLARWLPHVSIPIAISWSFLRRCAFSRHNSDVAVRLALHMRFPIQCIRPELGSPALPVGPETCHWTTATGPVGGSGLSSWRLHHHPSAP
ncbi:hypothetical protein LAZ67_4003113 [Cordylochernes scorpioides]|uniref:Transposase n=1 Tax=Cordylochernes scorpioides TaxID=51811 RepID=A0ABY6KF70_9ARAC|nr:hypothetical protein LAZ67_4003113 [Cordylochernes scorpioides]